MRDDVNQPQASEPPDDNAGSQIHGFLRGSVVLPPDLDLTEPVVIEHFDAEDGASHA